MFKMRKSFAYKMSYALELVEYDENRINYLIDRSVIRENGDVVELDDQYLEFFEQILEVNESINLSYVDENIKVIQENINYYLEENNDRRKFSYLRIIKKTFRKLGVVTIRNVVDLRRNIENTFKNEPNFKIKKTKLENLDKKRHSITELISTTLNLLNEEEQSFFTTATDSELSTIIIELKAYLGESSHNLIEIEKQIIDYLNQIKYQSHLIEKIRKIKYLKDQFLIDTDTDIKEVLEVNNAVCFEQRLYEPIKLSLAFLQTDEHALETIKRISEGIKGEFKSKQKLADNISPALIESDDEQLNIINIEELKNGFVATGNDLFSFITSYKFSREVEFNEKVTIFCQVVTQYENELNITENYKTINGVETAVVYPK
jgi:hypothetical protein